MGIFANKISIDDKERLAGYFDSFRYLCSGTSFSSLYMWRNVNEFTWEIIGDYLCIEGLSHLELEEDREVHFMMPPMTETGSYDEEALAETIRLAREKFERAGVPFTIRLVPGHMLEMIRRASPGMTFEEDRPNYDYIYETDSFLEYRGRKLHSKKNHLNYFLKNYDWQLESLRPEMTDEIMAFIRRFNRDKDIPPEEMKFLIMEEDAMEDALRSMDRLGCIGCIIRIDGKIEALAFGGWLGNDTIVEHIEKANHRFRGLYQLVLREFSRMALDRGAGFINREEDMDLDNLRKMKSSYHPCLLLDKYIGEIDT